MSSGASSKRHSDVMLRNENVSTMAANSPHHPRRTVEITNYPEHLNPFYKDDNHKRIRFMKVLPLKKFQLNSANKSSDRRRSSFSMDGIKEMWWVQQ